MTLRHALVALLLPLIAACADETVSGYADPGPWRLATLDGAPFEARATIAFPAAGLVEGEGPCNAWRAALRVPYPWFETGPVAATRRACPDAAAEAAFFDALGEMRLAEAAGDTLVLSTPEGREMTFRLTARDPLR